MLGRDIERIFDYKIYTRNLSRFMNRLGGVLEYVNIWSTRISNRKTPQSGSKRTLWKKFLVNGVGAFTTTSIIEILKLTLLVSRCIETLLWGIEQDPGGKHYGWYKNCQDGHYRDANEAKWSGCSFSVPVTQIPPFPYPNPAPKSTYQPRLSSFWFSAACCRVWKWIFFELKNDCF